MIDKDTYIKMNDIHYHITEARTLHLCRRAHVDNGFRLDFMPDNNSLHSVVTFNKEIMLDAIEKQIDFHVDKLKSLGVSF